MSEFTFQPIFEHGVDETPYRRLDEASRIMKARLKKACLIEA